MKRLQTWRAISIIACILGLLLISHMFWSDALDPLIFDDRGEYRTDGVFRTLAPLLREFNGFLDFGSWCCGCPLLLASLAGVMWTLPGSPAASAFLRNHRAGLAAFSVPVIANGLVWVFSRHLFSLPVGASIRPMGWVGLMAVITAATFVIAVPLGIIAFVKERPRVLGLIGVMMGFTPYFFADFLLNYAAAMRGLSISP